MAASNTDSTGRVNYYNVSYGKLSARFKEIGEDLTEITEKELKSLTQKVENIDLRNKYQEKGGDYPYTVYFDKIEGQIKEVKKEVYDKGISLNLSMIDNDGDNSIIQIKFYSKYTENLLNRLANVTDISSVFSLTPYAIPSEFEIDNKSIKVYNQGVSLKEKGTKVEVALKNTDTELPATERVQDAEGKLVTSRVKRINFLFDKVMEKFNAETTSKPVEKKPSKKSTAPAKEEVETDIDDDDLPF